ncbi:autotransporter assembly complex protein TamA [Aliidiomarina sp. Khilg15.8]
MAWTRNLLALMLLAIAPVSAMQDEDSGQSNQLEVIIEGVSDQVANNVRNRLSIYEYHNSQAPGSSRVRFLHRRAEQEILRALAPYGYYNASVERNLNRTDSGWRARYQIQTGEAMRIRDIDIRIRGDASDDPAFERLRNNLGIRPNQPLRHSNYESAKSSFRALAAERGYNRATFDRSELQIDLEAYAADIVLHFNSGPRFRLGTINFSESQLDEDVLRRFLPFEEGEYLTSDKLLELQMGLSDSGYFQRVQVQPQWRDVTDDERVPVSVELEPNARTHYRAGIGYGTDTGARLRFEQNRRWVNSRGHRFNAQFQLSEVLSNVSTNYIIPGAQPTTDQYAIYASWRDEVTDETQSELLTVGTSWQKQLDRIQRTISLDWQDERDRFQGESRNTQFLIPGIQWTLVRTRDRLDVEDGYRASLAFSGASEDILSSTNFVQATLSGKVVKSLSDRVRVLARADLGATEADDFTRIPTSLRFYAGGDNSIRGYAYRTIGPRNDAGDMLGGRHLTVTSVEMDYEFRSNWRVAAFVDHGNAYNNISDSFKTGAGLGVRWQSPVGPIRIDLAHGFDERGDTVRLHLTIGPDL